MNRADWSDFITMVYQVVDEESNMVIETTKDLSTAIDIANEQERRTLVLRSNKELVWDTEWENNNYHWKIKGKDMTKLIIFDYANSRVDIYDVDYDADIDDDYLDKLGYDESNIMWMVGENIEMTYHNNILK